MSWDLFDSIAGPLDILDRIESWVTFAVAPKSKRARHFGRLDLQQFSIPRADKMKAEGKRMVTLNETIAYLNKFGVLAKCNGFDSENMYFQIRRSQNDKGWVDYLLNIDADSIPQLDYDRKNWAEKATELKQQRKATKRQAKSSWLDNIVKEIF